VTSGQLLSGFAGALIVFVLGVLGAWWRAERERRGLLRLLWAEIDHNAEVVRTIAQRRGNNPLDWIGHPDLPSIKAQTWRDVQGRAAALLPNELTQALLAYYAPLEMVLTLLRFQDPVSDAADRSFRGAVKEIKPDWDVAVTDNPYRERLEQMLAAQDTARDRIRGYLSVSWADILLLVVADLLQAVVDWSKRLRRIFER
jgi:hypothetical protein